MIPGGETLPGLLSRTSAALREVLRDHFDETVVLVGYE